jgi:hypothetical protein
MKRQIIFLITVVFTLNVNAQSIEDSKQYFQQAKSKLENMLSDKEKPSYEKAIFTIENAWYDNQIDKSNFDDAMTTHIEAIQELIKNNYDEKAIKQKPSLLITQQEIKDQYKQALTNWAIYTYITSPTLFVDNKDTNTISFHRPYKYSTTDPMATTHWQNSQVVNLNNTHTGNCYALASFFKILADRLNSDATLCTAPSHIYISHKDDKGTDYNIELGSKYFPGTGMISALTYTTDQAIKSGISQRKLDTKQFIALCLVYLAKGYQHKFSNISDEFILQCANTAIQYDPKNLNALLLKSEYLENKLTAQKKSIAQLQTQSDFKEYQNLISNLYNLGYREMPLEMKNTLIKTYKHEPINKELPKFQTAKGKFATLSWGIFDERHTNKPTERIGNTIFNTKTNKILSFTKDQILYNNYNFDPVVFAWNIDPLAHEYPGLSPYSFAANNPIMFTDHKGAFIEGARGEKVTYKMLTNGKIQWSANASADTRRIGNALMKTPTGREQLRKADQTSYPIAMRLNKPKDGDFGKTDITGNFNNEGKFVVERVDLYVNVNSMQVWKNGFENKLASDGFTDAEINPALKKNIPTSTGETKQGYQDLLLMRKGKLESVIGATAGHEIDHATDQENIQANKEYENKMRDPKNYQKDVEDKPNQTEQKILNESTR